MGQILFEYSIMFYKYQALDTAVIGVGSSAADYRDPDPYAEMLAVPGTNKKR